MSPKKPRQPRNYVAYQVVCPDGRYYGSAWRFKRQAQSVARRTRTVFTHRIGGAIAWGPWRPCRGPHAIVVLRGTR